MTITIPFNPKIVVKSELSRILKLVENEAESRLAREYDFQIVDMMMRKLRMLFDELNYSTHKKSVVIFLSPVFQKVQYLDIAVDRQVIVDDSFSLREVVLNQQRKIEYLVVVLNGSKCQIFHFDGRSFNEIVSDAPKSYQDVVNEWPERVSNFTDVALRREIVMDKFLLRVDKSLRIVVNTYRLPLFVMGSSRVVGHFMKLTCNRESIVNVIYHDDHVTRLTLSKILAPYIDKWHEVFNKHLLDKIEIAAKRNGLAAGVNEVSVAAKENRIGHLIVEKDFFGRNDTTAKVFPIRSSMYEEHIGPNDIIEDIIADVLKYGGDVWFVDDNALTAFGHIVAIKRY
jgi:hypothetical protein